MKKPISISLSPNVEKDDVRLALKLIFQPWKWKKGPAVAQIEEEVRKYIGVKYAFAFNSGRTSLMAILRALDLPEGSEALLQAFTCNAAANPFLWSGISPIYVDCNKDDFNVNIPDLKAKIGPNSRVLMVQHTFGLPADMDGILAIVRQNNLTLIEDCAHSLGAEFHGQKVGTFGKAGFFSFGRDKIISSVWGGVAVTNDPSLAEKIRQVQGELRMPGYFWIFQQLLHPVLMNYIILPLYNVLDLGKIFLVLSQWLGILSRAVNWKEKRGEKPDYFPEKMPNALAILALHQFKKLERFNNRREDLATFYYANLRQTKFRLPEIFTNRKSAWLRFTIQWPKAHELLYQAWHKENMVIGDWYVTPIIPFDTNLDKLHYKMGSCPNAEYLAKFTFNLPTHINISNKDAQRIVDFLKKF
jgi:perosamine synthetase